MVNSPKVCLCIKILYPEVEHKKIIILSYKIHFSRSIIKTQ
jgi:hypothetical protein